MKNIKLYTEEQVKKAMKLFFLTTQSYKEILEQLTPIEIPSNEHLEERSKFLFPIENTVSGRTYIAHKSFIEGAKWMREKIIKQSK